MIVTGAAVVAALFIFIVVTALWLRGARLSAHWSAAREPANADIPGAHVELRGVGPSITVIARCRVIITDRRIIIARQLPLGIRVVRFIINLRAGAKGTASSRRFVTLDREGLDVLAMPRGIPPCLILTPRDSRSLLRDIRIIHGDHAMIAHIAGALE